jgi:hypothetical protein
MLVQNEQVLGRSAFMRACIYVNDLKANRESTTSRLSVLATFSYLCAQVILVWAFFGFSPSSRSRGERLWKSSY